MLGGAEPGRTRGTDHHHHRRRVGRNPGQRRASALHSLLAHRAPWYFEPCSGGWTSWSGNAEAWFNSMGYSTEEVLWPTQTKIQSHIQSDETAMFYELAHGGSNYFASGCVNDEYAEYTYASEIEAWIAGYNKMPFAFIGSCAGMCSTGDGTFAYEFRKGESLGTTVVGYCGMSEPQCDTCWGYSPRLAGHALLSHEPGRDGLGGLRGSQCGLRDLCGNE